MQLEHLTIDNDGVPRIHAALVANDDVSGAAQQIGDLSLALVTPLSTDDDNVGQSKGDSGPLFKTIRKCFRSPGPSSKNPGPRINQLPRTTLSSAL